MSTGVRIDKKRLKELERAQAKLNALENGGVDNWEFYDEAISSYAETIELEEKCEQILEDIEVALFVGAYEPSERGAGFAATENAREEALDILVKFINSL